jgi:hypothetical protein
MGILCLLLWPVVVTAHGDWRVGQAQEQLKAAGFNPSAIDGVLGPRTKAALRVLSSHALVSSPFPFSLETSTADPCLTPSHLDRDLLESPFCPVVSRSDGGLRVLIYYCASRRRGSCLRPWLPPQWGETCAPCSRDRKRLAAIRCRRIPLHRTGKDRIASSYSAEASASAKSRYMDKLFSSAWPLSNCNLGLMMPCLVRNVMIWCRKRWGYTRF